MSWNVITNISEDQNKIVIGILRANIEIFKGKLSILQAYYVYIKKINKVKVGILLAYVEIDKVRINILLELLVRIILTDKFVFACTISTDLSIEGRQT